MAELKINPLCSNLSSSCNAQSLSLFTRAAWDTKYKAQLAEIMWPRATSAFIAWARRQMIRRHLPPKNGWVKGFFFLSSVCPRWPSHLQPILQTFKLIHTSVCAVMAALWGGKKIILIKAHCSSVVIFLVSNPVPSITAAHADLFVPAGKEPLSCP